MADQQITLSLPEETIRAMQERVEAGEYPSLRDLILDSVEQPDQEPQHASFFGEDMDAWIANNRELLLRESEDWENHIPIQTIIAKYNDPERAGKPAA